MLTDLVVVSPTGPCWKQNSQTMVAALLLFPLLLFPSVLKAEEGVPPDWNGMSMYRWPSRRDQGIVSKGHIAGLLPAQIVPLEYWYQWDESHGYPLPDYVQDQQYWAVGLNSSDGDFSNQLFYYTFYLFDVSFKVRLP